MTSPLAPGSTIGILGGGQLGRMLVSAAAELGLKTFVWSDAADSPACELASRSAIAPYDDAATRAEFVTAVDVITFEFENIPSDILATLAEERPIRPDPAVLEITQDRLREKNFLVDLGIPTAPFRGVATAADVAAALPEIGCPAVLKTRRLGYDGKGQAIVRTPDDAEAAFAAIGAHPAIVEAFVPFACEASVVLARDQGGAINTYDVSENAHGEHILRQAVVPAGLSPELQARARDKSMRIAAALGHVGVLAVEFFALDREGNEPIMVNEIAPRVHNSGHWTQDACAVSQFENHIRAVAGWPLGAPDRHADAQMDNLIGDDIDRWLALAAEPGVCLHFYGKAETRARRKMGHVTRLAPLGVPFSPQE